DEALDAHIGLNLQRASLLSRFAGDGDCNRRLTSGGGMTWQRDENGCDRGESCRGYPDFLVHERPSPYGLRRGKRQTVERSATTRMPPLMVCSLMGEPPLPSRPCVSRGRCVLASERGSSEEKLPLRQRASTSACVSAGTARSSEPFVVSAVAPVLS